MKKNRKTYSFLACCLVAISLISCTQEPDETNPENASSSENTATAEVLTEPLPLPLVEPGSVTLSVYTPDNYYVPKSYNDNLPVYQELEELTGVTIDWEAAPSSDYATALQTRLAAAVDLPDIFIPQGGSSVSGRRNSIGRRARASASF